MAKNKKNKTGFIFSEPGLKCHKVIDPQVHARVRQEDPGADPGFYMKGGQVNK